MELQSIKITTSKETTYKPKGIKDSTNNKSFSNALEKVASKDETVKQEADNTSNKVTESKTNETKETNVKLASEVSGVKKDKPLEETKDLDPSLQGIMAMIKAFTDGKIDLNTFLSGASEDIKELVEQKISSDLNVTTGKSLSEQIKELSLTLVKKLENPKQNETNTKDLPSVIMEQIENYIKTLQSDTKNILGKSDIQGNLLDKIKIEISNIVLKNLKEAGINVTNTSDGIKVINNKGNSKEILNTENSILSLNENANDSGKVKLEKSEGKTMTFEKQTAASPKSSMSNEDKVLKNILEPEKEMGNKDSSIVRVANFVSQFEPIRNEKIMTETLVINKSNFSEDIVKSVKFMQLNNIRDLTVTIAPKELGEVIIKLTMDGGIMKASITATNKEAYNILNSNLTDITSKLNILDAKIQDFTLNIYNGDTTFFKQGSKGQNSKEQNNKSSENGNKEVDELALDSDVYVNNADNVNILV